MRLWTASRGYQEKDCSEPMKAFTLPQTGETAQISVLTADDLVDVLALHATTRASLPADKKRFILPQNDAYFHNLVNGVTGVMVGIRAPDGTLIAQMGLMGPLSLREAIAEEAITHNDVPFHHASLNDSVIVFKSIAAHPDWAGNGLAKQMMAFALELPLVRVAAHVFAQTSASNVRGWSLFTQHQFGIVSAAYDPLDGLPRFIFQRPAFGFEFSPAIIADDADPIEDFPAIVALTQREALIGICDPDARGKLAFMRNREASTLVPTVARLQSAS